MRRLVFDERQATRVEEARGIADGAGWPAACPDGACRTAGRCAGPARLWRGGPYAFPTCQFIVARLHQEPDTLTVREREACLNFLEPGAGWRLVPLRGDEATSLGLDDAAEGADAPEAVDPQGEEDGRPAAPHQGLIWITGVLTDPAPAETGTASGDGLGDRPDQPAAPARKPPARSMKLATMSTPTPALTFAKT